jgi:hypothetical protein
MPQREASKSRQNSHQTATRIEFFHAKKRISLREKKSVRGVFEHPAGSGIWWINYYVEGAAVTARRLGDVQMHWRSIPSRRTTHEQVSSYLTL